MNSCLCLCIRISHEQSCLAQRFAANPVSRIFVILRAYVLSSANDIGAGSLGAGSLGA